MFIYFFFGFHPILNFDSLSRSSLRASYSIFYVYTPHALQQTKWSSLLSNETFMKIVSDDVQTMHDSHWQVFMRFSLSYYTLPLFTPPRYFTTSSRMCITSAFTFYFIIKSSIKCIYVEKRWKHLKSLRSLTTLLVGWYQREVHL